jgi:hypothetical protein
VVKMDFKNITFLPHPPAGKTIHETMREFSLTVKPIVDEMVRT